QFNIDTEIIGIELEFVIAKAAGLIDIHDQVGDVAVTLDAPMAVARGISLIIDRPCHSLRMDARSGFSRARRLFPEHLVSFRGASQKRAKPESRREVVLFLDSGAVLGSSRNDNVHYCAYPSSPAGSLQCQHVGTGSLLGIIMHVNETYETLAY